MLIHEATLTQCLHADAVKKGHSTFSEAVGSARAMGAGYTILTHFSQRYAKIPIFDEFRQEANVGAAYDNVSVCPRTLSHLSEGYEALETIFKEELGQMMLKESQVLPDGRKRKGVVLKDLLDEDFLLEVEDQIQAGSGTGKKAKGKKAKVSSKD